MSIKTCPSCHSEVPNQAFRCKTCFHDFEAKSEKKAGFLMTLLTLVSIMGVIASVVLYLSTQKPSERRVEISEEAQLIVVLTRTKDGLEVQPTHFRDVRSIEETGEGEDTRVVVHAGDKKIVLPGYASGEEIQSMLEKNGYNIR